MKNEQIGWQLQTLPFEANLHESLIQQHHAAQYIAMAGRYLITQQDDDSNTSMQYIGVSDSLCGNELANGTRLSLNLSRLEIHIEGTSGSTLYKIPLVSRTKKAVFAEIKRALTETGTDVSNLTDKMHYDIPPHHLDKGSPFKINEAKYFIENSRIRSNAGVVIQAIITQFKNAPPLRIWPHHFDSGSFIPLAYNESGSISRSLGIGWAIPDEMVHEPYYYLSFWSEKAVRDFGNLPKPETGTWFDGLWKGTVLKHSDILGCKSAAEQSNKVKVFFESAIHILKSEFA